MKNGTKVGIGLVVFSALNALAQPSIYVAHGATRLDVWTSAGPNTTSCAAQSAGRLVETSIVNWTNDGRLCYSLSRIWFEGIAPETDWFLSTTGHVVSACMGMGEGTTNALQVFKERQGVGGSCGMLSGLNSQGQRFTVSAWPIWSVVNRDPFRGLCVTWTYSIRDDTGAIWYIDRTAWCGPARTTFWVPSLEAVRRRLAEQYGVLNASSWITCVAVSYQYRSQEACDCN
jgi:hypothetical protein